MPIYEYECDEHGKFESLKPIHERHTEPCPECGAVCRQLMSGGLRWKWFPRPPGKDGFTSKVIS